MSSKVVPAREEGAPAAPAAGAPRPVLRRRKLLGLAGAGTLVLVVGGVIGRAVDQGVFSANTGPAYDAWRAWDLPGADNLDLVRAAILAANAHDSQP